VTGGRADFGNYKANQYGAGPKSFLVDEFSTAIMELANRRCSDSSAGAAGEVQAPLMRFGIVKTQGEISM